MAREETIRRNVALPVKNAAMILTIVGAVNWGLVALFDFDLVEWLAGERRATKIGGKHAASNGAARVVYGLVGLAGLVLALVPAAKQIKPLRRSISYPERSRVGDELAH